MELDFKAYLESTLPELYSSTTQAFPRTTKRQHSTQPVVVTKLEWVPYKGMKTLFVKGLAQSNGKEYNPIIVFKGVQYQEQNAPNTVQLTASDGNDYFLEQLSQNDNEVIVRCNCPDFRWRFRYYNHLDRSLFGSKGKKYEGQGLWEANPSHNPGLCKHVMKLWHVLGETTLLR